MPYYRFLIVIIRRILTLVIINESIGINRSNISNRSMFPTHPKFVQVFESF